jgi:hypothetical protein
MKRIAFLTVVSGVGLLSLVACKSNSSTSGQASSDANAAVQNANDSSKTTVDKAADEVKSGAQKTSDAADSAAQKVDSMTK